MSGTTIDSGLTTDAGLLARISHPAEVNPLAAYASANQVAQGVWANRNALAQQAAGEAAQQATDAGGNFDPTRAQAIAARNPDAALAYLHSSAAGQELANKQLGLNGAQMGTVARSVSSVLALPDDQQTPENYRAALDTALAHGAITQAHHDAGVANLPSGGGPAAMRNYGTRLLVGTLAGPEVANSVLPRWQQTNTGQEVQPQVVQPPTAGGGVTNAPGATPIVPSRESLNQRTIVGYDANKNPIYGPQLAVTPAPLAGPLGTGRPPPGSPLLKPPAAGGSAAPADAAPAPSTTGMVVQPGPASVAAQTATGETSAKKFQEISDQGVAARSQNAILGNMLADTAQFTTGPGAEGIKNFKAIMQRVGGVVGAGFGISADKIAANESFDKFSAQLANAQGAGSDARLAVNQHANPNATLTPGGVDLILRQLQGNSDYIGARANLATQWGDKADSAKFETDVGKKLDPRAFQFARMTGPQKTAYVGALSATDRKAVQSAYNFAHENGLLP